MPYAWLNWMTVVLAASAFSDRTLGLGFANFGALRPLWFDVLLWVLVAVTVVLSIRPTLNFFARHPLMNFSYNPLHLVGSYGAFGSMSRERYEVVLEGTDAADIDEHTPWREYAFKGKPGDPLRRLPQWAPYHLRLDWMMWFLPFGVQVHRGQVLVPGYPPWFIALVGKLLRGDPQTLSLLAGNPFPDAPPRIIRARYYLHRFTTPDERSEALWWVRSLVGDFLPPVGLPAEQPQPGGASRPTRHPQL
ncbi:MAG: hypothetical protein ACYCW6_02065 [Candidatus Xenobia bacterium]